MLFNLLCVDPIKRDKKIFLYESNQNKVTESNGRVVYFWNEPKFKRFQDKELIPTKRRKFNEFPSLVRIDLKDHKKIENAHSWLSEIASELPRLENLKELEIIIDDIDNNFLEFYKRVRDLRLRVNVQINTDISQFNLDWAKGLLGQDALNLNGRNLKRILLEDAPVNEGFFTYISRYDAVQQKDLFDPVCAEKLKEIAFHAVNRNLNLWPGIAKDGLELVDRIVFRRNSFQKSNQAKEITFYANGQKAVRILNQSTNLRCKNCVLCACCQVKDWCLDDKQAEQACKNVFPYYKALFGAVWYALTETILVGVSSVER